MKVGANPCCGLHPDPVLSRVWLLASSCTQAQLIGTLLAHCWYCIVLVSFVSGNVFGRYWYGTGAVSPRCQAYADPACRNTCIVLALPGDLSCQGNPSCLCNLGQPGPIPGRSKVLPGSIWIASGSIQSRSEVRSGSICGVVAGRMRRRFDVDPGLTCGPPGADSSSIWGRLGADVWGRSDVEMWCPSMVCLGSIRGRS